MPYKATINMDQDDWTEFVNICKSLDTTASQEVRGFIEAYKQGKVYDHANLDKLADKQDLDDNSEDLIADKVIAKLRPELSSIGKAISDQAEQWRLINQTIKTDTKTDTRTDGTDLKPISEPKKQENIGLDIETEKETEKEIRNTTTESDQTDKSKELATSNIITEDVKLTEPLEDWARTVYTDKEVAEIEGINKATVTKRRTGKLKSKGSDFWDRWELSTLNLTRWWKKHDADFSQTSKNNQQE